MKRTVWLWELFGFAVTSLLGTLLHFLFEFSGGSVLTAPFSGVNESTFEHMKLLFWPMLLFAVFQSFFFKAYPSFFCVKLRGILLGLTLIPIIFCTYNGTIGKSPDWVNISIFFISAAIAFFFEARLLRKDEIIAHDVGTTCRKSLAIAALCLISLAFIFFTFLPPHLEIFKDPITGNYGII